MTIDFQSLQQWKDWANGFLAKDPIRNHAELANLFLHGREVDPRYAKWPKDDLNRIPEQCRPFTGVNTIIRKVYQASSSLDPSTRNVARELYEQLCGNKPGFSGAKHIIVNLNAISIIGHGEITWTTLRTLKRELKDLKDNNALSSSACGAFVDEVIGDCNRLLNNMRDASIKVSPRQGLTSGVRL